MDGAQRREGVRLPGGRLVPFGALAALLLAAVTAFRFRLLSAVPLSGDEAYHWEWSRHLAFSYYDHPGLTAWVIWAFTRVFGHTLTGVRIGALLSTTLILAVIYFLAKDIYKSPRAGFFASAIAAFTGIFTAGSLMMTTDPPYAAFWSLAVLFMYLAVFRKRPGFFYLAGIAFGLSMLGKFLGLLLVPCIFFFLAFSPAHRYWLFRKEPYIACILGLLMLAPVFYWNAKNDWATFAFNLSIRHEDAGPHLLYLLEYIGGQLIIISPLIFIPLVYISFRAWGSRRSEEKSTNLFLLSFTAVPLVAFGLVSIFERAGAHWPAAAYVTGVPLFTGWLLNTGKRAAERYVRACLIILFLFISAGHVLILRPDLIPEFRYEFWPEKVNTEYLREYYGWEELGDELSYKLERLGDGAFLMSPYYSFSATVSFYTPGQPFCHFFGKESIHGNSYRYWTDWKDLKGKNAVYVGIKKLRGRDLRRLRSAFYQVLILDPMPIYYRGKHVRTFYLAVGYRFKGIPRL